MEARVVQPFATAPSKAAPAFPTSTNVAHNHAIASPAPLGLPSVVQPGPVAALNVAQPGPVSASSGVLPGPVAALNVAQPGPFSASSVALPGPVAALNVAQPGPFSASSVALPGPVAALKVAQPGPFSASSVALPGPVAALNVAQPGPFSASSVALPGPVAALKVAQPGPFSASSVALPGPVAALKVAQPGPFSASSVALPGPVAALKVAQPGPFSASSVALPDPVAALNVAQPGPANLPSVPQPVTAGTSKFTPPAGSPRRAPRKPRRPTSEADQADQQDGCRVHVTGYPSYSNPGDITRAFSSFGTVKLEKFTDEYAIVVFSNGEEAKAAMQTSKKLIVYGEFLTLKPHSAKQAVGESPKPVTPKREFPRSKQNDMIILPKQIDLSGDFYHQLDNILSAVRLTQEDVAALSALYTDLEAVLQAQWPGCSAIPFGSITTGLGTKTSDADCFISVPAQFRHPHTNFVNKAKRLLQQYPQTFAEILSIPRANTPIVKLFYLPTETNCDVTFKTPLGVQNSKLIAFLLHADPRLIPMAVTIKYWAKVHDLTGTGKLTNYALTMLMIFYLQQPPISILPSVEWLQRDRSNDIIVDFWNTGFMCQLEFLPPSSNTSSISELLGGFFEYYAIFDFDEMVVCPYLGMPIKKEALKDLSKVPSQYERYVNNIRHNISLPTRVNTSICVQDPFEHCHNVASAITTKLALDIRAFFKFAANAYEKEKLNKCNDFLRIILLQKPKLVRCKSNPEFRVNLFPRIIVSIINPDWKSIVREIMFTIFERLLKIKLGKMEEKVNLDTKKEKEKYNGVITKAIWKRKQFSRLYCLTNVSFEDKQVRITEEIYAMDKQLINVEFQLLVTYCHDPKSAVILIRFSSGDLDAFRDFGKFFISITQNWFVELLKPYAKPAQKDMAAKIAETIKELDSNLTNNVVDSDDDSYLDKDTLNAETS